MPHTMELCQKLAILKGGVNVTHCPLMVPTCSIHVGFDMRWMSGKARRESKEMSSEIKLKQFPVFVFEGKKSEKSCT